MNVSNGAFLAQGTNSQTYIMAEQQSSQNVLLFLIKQHTQ